MNKVLDLSAFKVETLDITMLDGTTLNINKPTQRIYIEILKLQNIAEEKRRNEATWRNRRTSGGNFEQQQKRLSIFKRRCRTNARY